VVSGTALPLGKEPLINAERCCCLLFVEQEITCTLPVEIYWSGSRKISEEFSIINIMSINNNARKKRKKIEVASNGIVLPRMPQDVWNTVMSFNLTNMKQTKTKQNQISFGHVLMCIPFCAFPTKVERHRIEKPSDYFIETFCKFTSSR
jgi:hypothetical protein